MAIEFLYAKDDVLSFIKNLYDQGYHLAKKSNSGEAVSLTQADAVSALTTDLFFPGSAVYWIEDRNKNSIVQLIACEKQSDPFYVGKQGRMAGYLSSLAQNEQKDAADQVNKVIQTYLKKHGTFRNYNPNARMSCYFLPSYLQMDADYCSAPLPDHICQGGLKILCKKDLADIFLNKLSNLHNYHSAVQSTACHISEYWEDRTFSIICCGFLCDRNRFLNEDLQKMIRWISDDKKAIFFNQKLRMIAEAPYEATSRQQSMDFKITIFIDNPWRCWIGKEESYSGKPTILWPNVKETEEDPTEF